MHIIQYLLNLPFKNNLYKGEGNLVVLAEADVKLVLYHFKSILKFKPNDIGYDINGTEWKIISVYYDNNSYSYEAFNGTKVVFFDNFDLYNASEINDIYQNNLDSKIESIMEKNPLIAMQVGHIGWLAFGISNWVAGSHSPTRYLQETDFDPRKVIDPLINEILKFNH